MDTLRALKETGYFACRIRKEKLKGEATLHKLRKGEPISWDVTAMLCHLLHCQPGDLIEYTDMFAVHFSCAISPALSPAYSPKSKMIFPLDGFPDWKTGLVFLGFWYQVIPCWFAYLTLHKKSSRFGYLVYRERNSWGVKNFQITIPRSRSLCYKYITNRKIGCIDQKNLLESKMNRRRGLSSSRSRYGTG